MSDDSHSHAAADRQHSLGLYGAFVVAPRQPEPVVAADVVVRLQEWTVHDGRTVPAMPMEGLLPSFFTINGKASPATDTIRVRVGEQVRVGFIGTDANGVSAGQCYDGIWTASKPGRWLLHYHINHHLPDGGTEQTGAGGLSMVTDVAA